MSSKNTIINKLSDALKKANTKDEVDYICGLIDDHLFFGRQSDILEWGRHYFPHKFNLPFCAELHRHLVSAGTNQRDVTMAPRGHAKTAISCFLVPIYYALNEPKRFTHILNVQKTYEKALAVNTSIRREIKENDEIIKDYGDQSTKETWTQKQFVLKNGVVFTAIGANQSTRGINYRNRRPDYIIVDDIYDDDDIHSQESRKKTEAWFFSTLYPARAVGKKTCIQIRGTAIHQNDLMHQLMRSEGWTSKKFKACDFNQRSVLWPEVHTIDSLERDRDDMGSLTFAREYLNEPWDEESAIILPHWINEVDELPPLDWLSILVGVDPADKQKANSDYTGKCVAYVSKTKDVYVVHLEAQKLTQNENIKSVVKLDEQYRPNTVLIETNKGYGLFEELRDKTSVPVREVIAKASKNARLMGVQSFFENGKVYFVRSKLDKRAFTTVKDQLTQLMPDNDDIRDALVMVLESVREYRERNIY